MYLPSVKEMFLAQPPMYLITGRGAPMQLAADAASFRRPCDVHLTPASALVLIVRSARASHVESVEAAVHSVASTCEKLQNAEGGAPIVGRAEGLSLLGIIVKEVR
jgi:hypothetical protein